MTRKRRPSVLDGTDDPAAPSWKQASADELLFIINGRAEASPVAENELRVRLIQASEAAAAESAATGRKLVWLTVVLVILTVVLVVLTVVLAVGD